MIAEAGATLLNKTRLTGHLAHFYAQKPVDVHSLGGGLYVAAGSVLKKIIEFIKLKEPYVKMWPFVPCMFCY